MAYQPDAVLKISPLVVPLTRPTMMWGVPRGAFIAQGMGVTTVFVVSHHLAMFLWFIITHPILYMLTIRDPYFVEILRVKLTKTMPVRNKAFWGANSFSPD
ncbi:hypothetical protein GCM10007874_10530 [Labrys miyagiensis]|uniref:Type IV secretion system protein VirB3 n=1 Tax=Labrys miyagiensis TaxID=346912 RepID=A0ABQ6CEF4_9HYPH|nr:VirB3 family type IV secretion system protein [Labrys miyagiensis]GLS18037.1 hypothetical protein GCM10007874_10530 [Labrys miyagiensis]